MTPKHFHFRCPTCEDTGRVCGVCMSPVDECDCNHGPDPVICTECPEGEDYDDEQY